jgi:hypothetical protein
MGVLMVFMFRTKEGETEGNNGFMESFTLGRGTSTSSININWTSFSLEIRHFIGTLRERKKTFMMIAEKLFSVNLKWQVIHVGTMISIIN